MPRALLGVLALAAIASVADAAPPGLPEGFAVLANTTSPDGKLAVIAPDWDHGDETKRENFVVETATGTIVGTLTSPTIREGESHADALPRWSRDGSVLLWYVQGKWEPRAFLLARFDQGRMTTVEELFTPAADAIIGQIAKTKPALYAKVKQVGDKYGAFYKDGFRVDVKPTGGDPLVLPLKLTFIVESNPKEWDDVPADASICATVPATLRKDGKLKVGKLRFAPRRVCWGNP